MSEEGLRHQFHRKPSIPRSEKLVFAQGAISATQWGMKDARRFSIPAEVEAEMTPVVRAFVQGLLTRMAELEARLGKSPQNSSLPPSTQHPHAKPVPRQSKSKKKRGGQPGHAKHERPLLPSDQCDEVHRLMPTQCRRRGTKLAGCGTAPWRSSFVTPR